MMREHPTEKALPPTTKSAESTERQHAQENAALRKRLLEIIKRQESLRQAKPG